MHQASVKHLPSLSAEFMAFVMHVNVTKLTFELCFIYTHSLHNGSLICQGGMNVALFFCLYVCKCFQTGFKGQNDI